VSFLLADQTLNHGSSDLTILLWLILCYSILLKTCVLLSHYCSVCWCSDVFDIHARYLVTLVLKLRDIVLNSWSNGSMYFGSEVSMTQMTSISINEMSLLAHDSVMYWYCVLLSVVVVTYCVRNVPGWLLQKKWLSVKVTVFILQRNRPYDCLCIFRAREMTGYSVEMWPFYLPNFGYKPSVFP